ncbi:hypothetical protein BGW36DRAFT_421507 [Talaromyces proteolyticus]|uniref:Uncharacterized protein n=1 Tax=Talaromyces proteolyticus TaxID=1131652 RepID=A0AAD4Q622_9EURO|nr:uncharacterized protein BGW36DRAFT_421507 [Talaromyces proteolyticus]KAH8704922.1 hypothetical protein BGW36DRAFT_421507 [Talaromyces proteolyticus]
MRLACRSGAHDHFPIAFLSLYVMTIILAPAFTSPPHHRQPEQFRPLYHIQSPVAFCLDSPSALEFEEHSGPFDCLTSDPNPYANLLSGYPARHYRKLWRDQNEFAAGYPVEQLNHFLLPP